MNAKAWTIFIAFSLCSLLLGCASGTGGTSDAKSVTDGNDKAIKKISIAIGQEPGSFNITSQQSIEAPTGYDGSQYTVNTRSGKTYKCEILEPSGFGKVMTWGMASGVNAMCTDFTKGSKDQGKMNKASCNALLRAAGKC